MSAPHITGPDFQHIAHQCQEATVELLNELCISLREFSGQPEIDGGPVIMGAFGGLLEFAMRNGASEAELREKLIEQIGVIWPQMVLAMAAERAGAPEAGTA
jgi:hypothetical protein